MRQRCPLYPRKRTLDGETEYPLRANGRPRRQRIVLIFELVAWRLAMNFKPFALCTLLAISLSPKAIAEPLVTISCEKPEGVSMAYGVSLTDRMDASANSQSGKIEPSLKGPTKDGYRGKPTFVIELEQKGHHHFVDRIPRRS